jgi:MFS family permease
LRSLAKIYLKVYWRCGLHGETDRVESFTVNSFSGWQRFGLGAAFMGVAMLGSSIVSEPQRSSTRIAQVTAIFSAGQAVGPLFSAYSYQHSGSYNGALLGLGIIHHRSRSPHVRG